jgi:RHS repeat-associated protein
VATAGDLLQWHPHLHLLTTDGGFAADLTTLPDNRTTTKSYGLWSETTADAGGKSVTTTRSTRGSTQTKTIGGQQVTTTSTFDLLGRLTGLQETAGQGINNQWTWSYDSLGRKTGQNDPDAGVWTWSYDETSRTTTQTDAIGHATVSAFDNMGRVLRKTSLSGVTTLGYSESRGNYSNIGRLTSVSSPGTALQLDYDSLGNVARATRAIDSTTFTMSTDYDLAGRVADVTYYDLADGTCSVPGTCTIGPFTYDGAGRVAGIQGILDDVTYDAAGRPLVQSNSNGTVTTKTYWPHRGLLNTLVTTTPAQAGPVQNLTYSDYDDVGNLRQVTGTIPAESWQYGYDDGYRMSSASSGAGDIRNCTYDAIGRITYNSAVGTYAYPPSGQPRPHAPLTVSSLGSFTYDANGNLLTGNGRAVGWSAENLPTQVTSGGATTSFAYDGMGERMKKLSASGTSYYPFGDDYEVTNGVVTAYVSVPGLGVVAKRVGTGTNIQTFWLHTDRQGSINAITTDGSQYPAGTLVLRRTYAPYGETLSTIGTPAESRGWIDQRNDSETGLTYLHARYFDPKLGSFLSADPIGVKGGMHLYGYGFGDPVNNLDPSGTAGCQASGKRVRAWHEQGGYVWGDPYCLNWAQSKMDAADTPANTTDPAGPGGTQPPGPGRRRPRDGHDHDPGACDPATDPGCKQTACDPATDPGCKTPGQDPPTDPPEGRNDPPQAPPPKSWAPALTTSFGYLPAQCPGSTRPEVFNNRLRDNKERSEFATVLILGQVPYFASTLAHVQSGRLLLLGNAAAGEAMGNIGWGVLAFEVGYATGSYIEAGAYAAFLPCSY